MGTRCNVIVKHGDTKINLYRHWDGYYAETGYDLITRLGHCMGAGRFDGSRGFHFNKFATNLINAKREPYRYDPADKEQYELTNGIHGDVEFIYRFTWKDTNRVILNFSQRRLVKDSKGELQEEWTTDISKTVNSETIEEVFKFMEDEKLAMRERARKVAI